MIYRMKNYDFIRVLSNEDERLLFNENNLNSVIINKEVYDLIAEIKSIDEYDEIVKEFCDEDQEFFRELRKVFTQRHIFDRNEKEEKFKRVNFIITDYCNLFCRHCCYSAKFLPDKSFDNRIDKELDILDRIIALKPTALSITGGEPLTVSNFDEVIDRIKKSGIKTRTLQTNGTLINECNVKKLTDTFDAFDISLDGSTPEETEKIRGKGVYEKVIKAIDLLKKNGIKKISVSCAMNLNEVEKRERFEQLCKDMSVTPIIRQMTSSGRAKANDFNTRDRSVDFFGDTGGEYCNCPAGRTEMTVNCKGEVFPCPNFVQEPFVMGNIFDDDILEKLGWDKKHDWYKCFSEYVSIAREECMNCEVNMFCWHCPFQIKNYMELNNIKSLKAICERKKKAVYRRIWNNENEIHD